MNVKMTKSTRSIEFKRTGDKIYKLYFRPYVNSSVFDLLKHINMQMSAEKSQIRMAVPKIIKVNKGTATVVTNKNSQTICIRQINENNIYINTRMSGFYKDITGDENEINDSINDIYKSFINFK